MVCYCYVCAQAIQNVFSDEFEDRGLFLKRFSIEENQSISFGVYERGNVLKAKFVKTLFHYDVTIKASLLN